MVVAGAVGVACVFVRERVVVVAIVLGVAGVVAEREWFVGADWCERERVVAGVVNLACMHESVKMVVMAGVL